MATEHIGETFDLYMINGFVCGVEQTSESASNYSLVIDNNGKNTFGGSFGGLQIEVLTADGTKVILTPNDDSTDADKKGSEVYTAGKIVTWTGDNDDATVKIIDTKTPAKYTAKTKSVGGITVADNAVLYVLTDKDDNTYKAYNLRDLDD